MGQRMNNHKITLLNWISAVSIIMILICSLLLSIHVYRKQDFRITDNTTRQQLNVEREEINDVFLKEQEEQDHVEQNKEEQNHVKQNQEEIIYPDSSYPYLVIDQKGKVCYADSEWNLQRGDTTLVEESIQQDHSFASQYKDRYKYSLVLTDGDECAGFLVYLLPLHEMSHKVYGKGMLVCFLPVIVGIGLSIILLIVRTIYCNRRILKPLRMVHQSADAIIKGNYSVEVQRIFETELQANEVGDLIYSFELMRDELKAKQESEQALKKSQQELISCISHDLRTPISTIKAYSEGIRDGISTGPDETAEFLSIIIKKTNLLEGMITELLEYSNTQLNKMSIEKKDIYLNDYLKDILRELRIYVTQKNISFEVTGIEQNVLVYIDTKRITEVLYNLVENSMKYIGEGNGSIQIKVQLLENFIEIHVIDNGMGIMAEDIPYVFDKFYRAEKSRSSNIAGSGLGLSICKYIIEQHGGEIHCRSRKSQGSDFWFTLPI